MDSLEALNRIRMTAKDLEGCARVLQMAAQSMEQGSAAADWLSLQPVLAKSRLISFKITNDGSVDLVFGGLTESLGWRAEEFHGRQLADLLDPSVEYEESPLAFLNSEESNPGEFRQPLAFMHRSGWRVWLMVTIMPHYGSSGVLAGFDAVAFDINDERLRISELERRNGELQEQLARPSTASASEQAPEPEADLWTTLAARQQTILLNGMARLNLLLQEGPAAQGEDLAGLDWAVHWLSALAQLTREPEGWRKNKEQFSPRSEVARAAALFRPVGATQTMSGKIEENPELPEQVHGNLTALRAAILEVLDWASRTLPYGGLVLALHTTPDGKLHVVFKCYGIVEEITDRAEQSLELHDLATCRNFLKVLGGRLRVDRFLDGVEVQISIPCSTDREVEPAPRARPATAEGLSILLAEDDEISRKVAVRALKNMGHHVVSVGTGLEVLQAVTEDDYDVVLLDVQMPDMDGVDAARQLRRRFFPCPYLIALTAGNTAADRRRVMEAGMHDFLAKPFKADDLRDALSQIPFYNSGASASPSGDA